MYFHVVRNVPFRKSMYFLGVFLLITALYAAIFEKTYTDKGLKTQ